MDMTREEVVEKLEFEKIVLGLRSPFNEALAILKNQPEIIRCKYCKWRGIEYGYSHGWCEKNHGSYLDEDFFCADGERKDYCVKD